jgi:hypothetical protein
MSDWGWVSLAYVVVYATLAGYVINLLRRSRSQAGRLPR